MFNLFLMGGWVGMLVECNNRNSSFFVSSYYQFKMKKLSNFSYFLWVGEWEEKEICLIKKNLLICENQAGENEMFLKTNHIII